MKPILLSQQATRLVAVLVIALAGVSKTSLVFSQAQLVKDMNTSEYRHFNEYSQLTNAEGYFFFVSNGKELWRSDGTPQGTRRLKTIRHIENLTFIDNTLFFSGTDVSGAELWKSDGTSAGTLRLKDIRKGLAGSSPKNFTSSNGTIYFVADNGTGPELWKTNGTSAGTVLVKDIWAGTSGSEPSYLTMLNELLYFSADDGVHGRELWRTDGTNAGTVMIKDIQTTEGESSEPQELVALNDFLYFSAYHTSSGRELWRSNGTSSGTIRLKDINPGPESSGIGSIRRMGNAIYFNANDGTAGTALWRSSGTTAGTVMLKDLTGDNLEYLDFDMTVINNRLYWLLATYSGHEVWVSNGTAAGTRLATIFENRTTPAQFTYLNNKVYFFSAYWSQDPYAPYQQLSSINPDGSDWREAWSMWPPFTVGGEEDEFWYEFTMDIIAFNNSLFFPGVRNETEGYKLLKSDGTNAPTVLVNTYQPTQSSTPNTMVKNNSDIYFVTSDNGWDNQHLWRTDGTGPGTVRIKSHFGIGNITSMNNTVYFTVRGEMGGWQLWKSDGTPASTIMLKEDYSYDFDAVLTMQQNGNKLFFYTYQGELWTSDGTTAGTVFLRKFPGIEHLAASGSTTYVITRSVSGGQELWKSNGTPGGTVKVRTIRSVDGPTSPNHLGTATVGNIFYFIAYDEKHGHEVWGTDGTNAGTYRLTDIRTHDNNPLGAYAIQLMEFNNALYFIVNDGSDQLSLFRSDGTIPGTARIHDTDRVVEFIKYDNQLLFVTSDFYELELWSTDGTTAGTRLIKALRSSYELSISHAHLNGFLYITYAGSNVIWRTDGTECGTFDIDVGLKNINNLAPLGSSLLFSANHSFYGNELFSFDAGTVTAPVCPETWAARIRASDESDKEVLYTPNPFERDFNFVVRSEIASTAEVGVYDMAGHPVAFEKLDTNKSYQLGNSWKEGLYILRIVVDGKVSYKRVVKSSQ